MVRHDGAVIHGEASVRKAKWIYQYTKGTRVFMFLLSLAAIVSAFCNVLIAYVLKLFIDVATGEQNMSLASVVMLAGGVLIIGGAVSILASVLRNKLECDIEAKLRTEIMGAVFGADYYDMSCLHTGEILTRITEDAAAAAQFFPCVINDVIGSIAVALIAVVYLFILNTKLTLIMFVAIPILIAVISLFNFPIAKADKLRKEAEEQNRICMQEQLANIKSIKTYHARSRCLEILRQLYGKFSRRKIRFGMWEGLAFFLNGLISNAMLLIALGVGAYFIIAGQATVGALVAVVQLLNYIIQPFGQISQAVSKLAQAGSSVDRICEILNVRRDISEEEKKVRKVFMLNMKNICFSYGDKCILRGFSYRFSKGRMYCIVGENGSGKSTLLHIIAGLYRPLSGEITLTDEHGAEREVNIQSYISFVSAEEKLFSASVKDNITFFEPDADIEKVSNAIEQVQMMEYVRSLPQNMDSDVAEEGKSLSSGQIQRIAISRTLYQNNDIIIMDEPTTNLDAESVGIFLSIITELKKNRIVIIASHDEQLIQVSDAVVNITEAMECE